MVSQYKLNNDDQDNGGILLPYTNPYARFGSDPATLGMYRRGQDTPWKGLGVQEKLYTRRLDTGRKHWDDDEAVGTAGEKRQKLD